MQHIKLRQQLRLAATAITGPPDRGGGPGEGDRPPFILFLPFDRVLSVRPLLNSDVNGLKRKKKRFPI